MGKINKTARTNRKRVIRITAVTAMVAALVFGCLFYVNDYYRASAEAQEAMNGNALVEVSEEANYYRFSLREEEDGSSYRTGVIFYPGGKVEETAYAPLLVRLAERGYDVYMVKMPAKLAIFGMNRADEIIETEEHARWIMMGHSLGGAMAANYSAAHDEDIDGLVLLAAYSTEDLNDKKIDVISFYGSNDQVLNSDKYKEYYSNLPKDMEEIIIEGGNHAYYGDYGKQDGDGTATISREEQMETVLENFIFVWTEE